MAEVLQDNFDTDGVYELTGVAGQQIKVVGIFMTNNEADYKDNAWVEIIDSTPTTLYGGGAGGVYLSGNGQSWGLPVSRDSVKHPYFITAVGKSLLIGAGGSQIAGSVWYYIE